MTSPWWPTEPSSVATRAPLDQRRALGVGGVAEAEQDERVGAERVLPDRQRRDPDAAAGEDGRRPSRGAREAAAERAEQPEPVAGAQLARAGACPGPTSSSMKSSVPSAWRRATENARGRNGRSSSPPPQRSAAASM